MMRHYDTLQNRANDSGLSIGGRWLEYSGQRGAAVWASGQHGAPSIAQSWRASIKKRSARASDCFENA
jgi:hypothetical protein